MKYQHRSDPATWEWKTEYDEGSDVRMSSLCGTTSLYIALLGNEGLELWDMKRDTFVTVCGPEDVPKDLTEDGLRSWISTLYLVLSTPEGAITTRE